MGDNSVIVWQGFLTKRAVVSGRNWRRRHFTLLADGTLLYKKGEAVDDPVKNSIATNGKSKALVLRELAAEGGFIIEGPTHDALYLKADSTREAKEFIKKFNDLMKIISDQETAARKNNLDVFSKKGGSRAAGGSIARQGGKEKRTPPPPEGGWVMRIGAGKTAKDVFVDANTWMYYADRQAFDKGAKALGKADLAALV